MSTPRFTSKLVPGLVMWPNGAIVTVKLTSDGRIERDKQDRPTVLAAHGRWAGGVDELCDFAVFQTVEKRLSGDG